MELHPIISPVAAIQMAWTARQETPPSPGTIRLLLPPTPVSPVPLTWWERDRTLTEWIQELTQQTADVSGTTIVEGAAASSSSLSSAIDISASMSLFYANQRARWLAHKTLNKWRWNIWSKRPQCGVDLIMNDPVSPADAVYLIDNRNRAVYAFHYRDLFTNLLTKITASDEMLPCPRPPTNPWTNQPLTQAQTIAVCHALLQHYATRRRCPPTLFAAFCESRFDLRRFEAENTALLAQHAIAAYFKDLHEHNRETVADTALELLRDAGARYSAVSFRRWLRQTPITPLHREWLALVRDYTLHLNLHLEPRRHWHTEDGIYRDVRELLRRTPLENPAGPRLRLLQGLNAVPLTVASPFSNVASSFSTAVLHLSSLGEPAALQQTPTDVSGAEVLLHAQIDISGDDIATLQSQATAALLLLLQQSFHAE